MRQKAAQMKEADDRRKAEEKKEQNQVDWKLQGRLKRLEEKKKQEERKQEERKQQDAKKAEEKKKADAENFRKDQDSQKNNASAFSAFVGA